MYRIDIASASNTLPSPATPGTQGYFTDGNPGTGAAPTILPADWCNRVQEELITFLTAASIAPSKSTYNQVAQSIQSGALNYALDTSGSANTITASLPISPASLNQGIPVYIKVAHTNTNIAVLNLNGSGNKYITYKGNTLIGGELKAGQIYLFAFDIATNSFQLLSSTGSTPTVYTGGTTGGSANTQTVSVTPAGYTLVYGNIITFLAGFSNTGAATLNVAGTGDIPIKKRNNVGLVDVASGDIIAGDDFMVLYDGVYYELLDPIIPAFGACASLNIGFGLKNDGSGNLAATYSVSTSGPSGGNNGDIWYQV